MANKKKKKNLKTRVVIATICAGIWILAPSALLHYIFSPFTTLISYIAWGVLIVGIIWLWRHGKKKVKSDKIAEGQRIQQKDYDLWNKLGNTREEREEGIKKLFDDNSSTITIGQRWDFTHTGNDSKTKDYHMQFRLSRNLALMEKREKEFLRTTFLLFNDHKINEKQWNYYRFALINGDGKASIDEYNYSIPQSYVNKHHIKDGITMIKYWKDGIDGSVESAINNLLQVIGDIEQSSSSDSLNQIKKRIHGNSSWLSMDEIKDTIFNGTEDYQLSLGKLAGSETMLSYTGEGSLITIAPPGAGKTQCFVIPNMLNWTGAAVVLDIKGEIYDATHKWREKNVGKIYKFSPLDPKNSNSFNPLTFIRQDTDYLWEDSRFLADMMIVPSGASDPFWENMARDVLTSAIAYICFENEPHEREVSKILDIIYGIGWDEMITSLKTNFLVRAMQQTGHSLDGLEPKQRDTILKTAQSSLSAWQGERIAKVTKESDWSPLDLRERTPTIYICINPNEIESYLSVIRVFIAQHIRMLTSELPKRGTPPVLFMLDEMPRLRRMPPIEEALSLGRQYGIKLWMFAQSYGQIKEAYPDPEGLLGSCVIRTFMNLPINDEITTKISDQLGFRHDALGNAKEKLVEPIELSGPNYKDLILVLSTNTKPAKLTKRFAYQDVELKQKIND